MGGAAFATTATGCCAFAWLFVWNVVNEKMLILWLFEDMMVLFGVMGVRKLCGTLWGGLLTSFAVLVIMLNNFMFYYVFFILMLWMLMFYE